MNNKTNKHILIIVENLPVPFDRRVWQEATTLKEAGYDISIICPIMKGYTKRFEVLSGIDIYRHPLPLEASGALGYLLEYSAAFFWELFLSVKIYFKKKFHVIHGCNPPDLIFLVAIPFKLFGVKYIFDHHDINPELYEAKFNKRNLFYKLMILFEKLTFKTSDASIATNNSYRDIAIKRGGMRPDDVVVIRSGPKLDRLRLTNGNSIYKKNRNYLLGYLGVIGEQEGIDLLLEAFKIVCSTRDDVQLAIVGGGTSVDALKKLSIDLGLSDFVDFYGRVSDELLVDILNTSDICVNPDKPTDMNNLSTMNKIMEYMALKKPIIQFDLKEGRYSAQNSSLYATDVTDFANKINLLLNDESMRKSMGEYGYNRVINELSWDFEAKKLIEFYKKVI